MKHDLLGYYMGLHRRFGDVVSLRLGPYRTYVFFHPDAVREILVTRAKQFRRFSRPLAVLAQWNGNSVLITEGHEWLRQRRMVQPAFHAKRFDHYAACMVGRARHHLERWLSSMDAEGGLEPENWQGDDGPDSGNHRQDHVRRRPQRRRQ
jgi:cytochrome P450